MAQNMGIIIGGVLYNWYISEFKPLAHRYNKSDNFNQVSHSISAKQLL